MYFEEKKDYIRSKSQIILRGNIDGKEFKIIPVDTKYFLYLEYIKDANTPTSSNFFEKAELAEHMESILPKVETSVHPDDIKRFYNYIS